MSDDKRKFIISGITLKTGTGTDAKTIKIKDFETPEQDFGSEKEKEFTITSQKVKGDDDNDYILDITFKGTKG